MQKTKIHLSIFSKNSKVFDKEVTMAVIPCKSGDMGLMHDHEPCVTVLREGEARVYETDITRLDHTFAITNESVASFEKNVCTILLQS